MSTYWKRLERRVAADLGTYRTPLSGGSSRITRADTLHSSLFVECKYRKRAAIFNLWEKVAALAKEEGKEPIIVQQLRGTSIRLATLRYEYWLELERSKQHEHAKND